VSSSEKGDWRESSFVEVPESGSGGDIIPENKHSKEGEVITKK